MSSKEILRGSDEADPDDEAGSRKLLEMLRRLPPSKELLDFYHKKLEGMVEEEATWIKRLGSAGRIGRKTRQVAEKDNADLRREVSALQRAVADMRSALEQERKITAKVLGENDRLRILENENSRKVLALLELGGKKDSELVRLMDNEDVAAMTRGMYTCRVDAHPRVKKYMDEVAARPGFVEGLRRTSSTKCLQIVALENQLKEQEKCHMNQISQLESERRQSARDREIERDQYETRIKELSDHVNALMDVQEAVVKEHQESKAVYRKAEKEWMHERETLLRKLQFVQTYGNVCSGGSGQHFTDGGFHTDMRGSVRRSADLKSQKEIRQLHAELADQKNLTNDYRSQLLTLEKELDALRDHTDASKEVLKKRTKVMVEHVESLRERYEQLEDRRRREAEGYQADVNILRQKLKHVEHQLVRAALGRAKEHDYIKTIRAYEEELDKLRRKARQQWQDP